MEWTATIALFALGVGMLALGRMLERPRASFRVPVVPPMLLLFLGGVLVLMAGSHMLTLLGISHGKVTP